MSMSQPVSTQPAVWTQNLIALARDRAADLGFASLGVSNADVTQASEGLRDWLAAGYHGDMDYMSRHASLRSDPGLLTPGTLSAVMVTMSYRPSDDSWVDQAWGRIENSEKAFVASYALGRDYHKVMRANLQLLAKFIETQVGAFGFRVFCDSAPVMEVALASKAQLGWRGKNTLLLNREQGSMFFIGTIYTDLPIEITAELTQGAMSDGEHCGTCDRCLTVCPTQAFVAPYVLDARKCISYLTIENKGAIPEQYRRAMGNRIYGCDDCQLVCPWNKYAKAASHPDFAARHSLDDSGLMSLFAWSASEFDTRMAGSAIFRIGYWRWLRNIAVGLGNALADSHSITLHAEIRSALNKRLMSCEVDDAHQALLAEHIEWALAQQVVAIQ
jgi:epoxyqueuosine reductase